jgi:hypothetical protein
VDVEALEVHLLDIFEEHQKYEEVLKATPSSIYLYLLGGM